MFYGIVETESLTNTSLLKNYQVVKQLVEEHPEAENKIWHINILTISNKAIHQAVESFSKSMKKGWFSIFWNERDVFVVFPSRVFHLERDSWESQNFYEMREYVIKQGVQEEYLDFEKNFNLYNILLNS